MKLPLPAEELIPHRLPLRLVERLLSIDGKNGVIEALVRADCPLVSASGELEDVALIELMAQGYATLKGYLDQRQQLPVRQGFLVGIKKMIRYQGAVVGDLLHISVNTVAELDDFAVAGAQVWRGDELLAEGDIKVWIN